MASTFRATHRANIKVKGTKKGGFGGVILVVRVVVFVSLFFTMAGPWVAIAYAAGDDPPPALAPDPIVVEVPDLPINDIETLPLPEEIVSSGEVLLSEGEGNLVPDDSAIPDLQIEANQETPSIIEVFPVAIPTVSDPYFYVDGTKYSFLPEGGNCAEAANCQVSTTPIQDALNTVSGGLIPDDNTIYIEGGIYTEDVTIANLDSLTLQGAADHQPTVLAGSTRITDSANITLRDFSFEQAITIIDSINVSIEGTSSDDAIEVTTAGTVENLSVDGGAGSDDITVNLQTSQTPEFLENSEVSTISVIDSGNDDDEDSLTVNANVDVSLADHEISTDSQLVSFDASVEALAVNIEGQGHTVEIAGEINLPGGAVSVSNMGGDVFVNGGVAVDVSGETGGQIKINADRIAVFGSLIANGVRGEPSTSSGQSGGAMDVIAADIVVVANDAVLTANAGPIGDGGTIYIIGERYAKIASSAVLEAMGGSQGGDGGFIETSGYQGFEIGAVPNVGASNGQAGEWLLDPANDINVISGSTNTNITGAATGTPTGVFASNSDSASIGVDNILTALGSADITITTGAGTANGRVNWLAAATLTYTGTAARTLTINAVGQILMNAAISSTNAALNITLNADTDGDGAGDVILYAAITTNGGTATFNASDGVAFYAGVTTNIGAVNINADQDSNGVGTVLIDADISTKGPTAADGDVVAKGATITITSGKKIDADNNGTIELQPSTVNATIGIGFGATGAFSLDSTELNTGLKASLISIGRSDGTGGVAIGEATVGNSLFIRGGDITFKGKLKNTFGHIGIFSNGRIIDDNPGTDAELSASWTLNLSSKNGVGTNGAAINELETTVGKLSGNVSAFGGFYLRNTGSLTTSTIVFGGEYVDGITTNGGELRITAESPLRVSRAIREKAGGSIDLTAGNNSAALGDNLTIEAEVSVTGGAGTITGNAGDDISVTSTGRVSTPGAIVFAADLDGDADNGGGKATVDGRIETTGAAAISITARNGITLSASSQIISQGGNLLLQAANGTATQSGLIDLHGGVLVVIERPPDAPSGGALVVIERPTDPSAGVRTTVTVDGITLPTVGNAVVVVSSGQQVSLLAAAAFGRTATLQLPDGMGATFNTGFDALASIISGAATDLPSALPVGFVFIASVLVDVQVSPDVNVGSIAVSFTAQADKTEDNLVILHWHGEAWVEVPVEIAPDGSLVGLTDELGTYVLATFEGTDSLQVLLSGVTAEVAQLQPTLGSLLVVTGGAGDMVQVVALNGIILPGDLPPGTTFVSGMTFDITANGVDVSLIPQGEIIDVSFDLPDGLTADDVVILYWLPLLNGGQGGWTALTAQITPNGRATLQTFFSGTFVLARQ